MTANPTNRKRTNFPCTATKKPHRLHDVIAGSRCIYRGRCLSLLSITLYPRNHLLLFLPTTDQKPLYQEYLTQSSIMPLVVPGINSATGPNQEEWLHKLAGKKITESSDSDVTVCCLVSQSILCGLHDANMIYLGLVICEEGSSRKSSRHQAWRRCHDGLQSRSVSIHASSSNLDSTYADGVGS